MKHCANCSAPLGEDQATCAQCGAPAAPEPANAPPPTAQAGPGTAPPRQPAAPPQAVPTSPPPKKKNGCLIAGIIAGVVGLLVVVGLVIGIVAFVAYLEAEESGISGQPTPEAPSAQAGDSSAGGDTGAGDQPSAFFPNPELLTVEGSWERYDLAYYGSPSYQCSQIDFLEDGTVLWYQTPGSENYVSGTYTAYQGEEALTAQGLDLDDFQQWQRQEAANILESFGYFIVDQYFLVAIDFHTMVMDGQEEAGEMYHEYTFYMHGDGTWALVDVAESRYDVTDMVPLGQLRLDRIS